MFTFLPFFGIVLVLLIIAACFRQLFFRRKPYLLEIGIPSLLHRVPPPPNSRVQAAGFLFLISAVKRPADACCQDQWSASTSSEKRRSKLYLLRNCEWSPSAEKLKQHEETPC